MKTMCSIHTNDILNRNNTAYPSKLNDRSSITSARKEIKAFTKVKESYVAYPLM